MKPPLSCFHVFLLVIFFGRIEGQSTKKLPEIIGMRVAMANGDPFGYDDQGMASVPPDADFRVVLYGSNMELIEKVAFVSGSNCSDAGAVVKDSGNFAVHFSQKASFIMQLPELPEDLGASYGLCIKPKGVAMGGVERLDDISTTITTMTPAKQYTLPLPVQIGVIAFFLCLSALFSGLTLGLMSLTPMELELVMKSGTPREQQYAAAILPIRRKGNQLLCALLLGNVIVNAAISILFGELTSGLLALAVSSLGIVIFGEIIPQSICVKKGLAVGAKTIAITQFFIFLTYPIAWPIAKLLDVILKDEVEGYDRKRLMEMMKLSMRDGSKIPDELKIAVGAMEIADKVVEDIMTKIDDVFMLPDSAVLNAKMIAEIVAGGYTRIPIYSGGNRNNVTDLLFVKDLALVDPDDNFTAATVCGYHKRALKFALHNLPLSVLLDEFKRGDSHLAMVKKKEIREDGMESNDLVGLVTLEDILEEILQAEIMDESDTVTDNKSRVKRKNREKMHLARFFENAAPTAQISSHLQLVTVQYLVANESSMGEKYIGRGILERLVSSSVKRVDAGCAPSLTRLYTKGEPRDRYILILEGRSLVTVGQSGMRFEGGPFHAFGTEILENLAKSSDSFRALNGEPDAKQFSFVPDYSAVITDSCTYLEVTVSSYINAVLSTRMALEKDEGILSPRGAAPITGRSLSTIQPIDDPTAEIGEGKVTARLSSEQARHALHRLNSTDRKRTRSENEEEMRLLKKELP